MQFAELDSQANLDYLTRFARILSNRFR